MENYMTVKETAAKWKITERQVQILCKTNRIQGAIQVSRIWLIPSNALKPTKTIILFVERRCFEWTMLIQYCLTGSLLETPLSK